MTYVFGYGDRIAFPKVTRRNGAFGGEVKYTDPSFDWCYTSRGFIVPMDLSGVPLNLIMDDALPFTPLHMDQNEVLCEYILIDFDAHVWRVFLNLSSRAPKIHYHYIYTQKESWWVASADDDVSLEAESLLGFLATHPSEEAVDAFWFETNQAETLSWFSISDIVERLDKKYPDRPNKTNPDEVALGLKLLRRLASLREKSKDDTS